MSPSLSPSISPSISPSLSPSQVIGSSGVIQIAPDGTTDFDIKNLFPNGIYLRAIHFKGSLATDVLYVRDKTVTGAHLIPSGLGDGETYTEILPKRRFPYIDVSECTFATAGSCLITIYFD